jgi:S1-C subfamily serine protease
MRRFVSFGPALVVLLTVAAVLFAAPATVKRIGYARVVAQVSQARQSLDGDDILDRLNAAVRNVATAVEPSIVHIEAYSSDPHSAMRDMVASGSGWVYDTAGHVITNAHVIRGADRFEVQFFDGRRVSTTEVVGEPDVYTDIAVLKLDTDSLVPVRRATNDHPQQGDRVFVFGSPFGFKFSMSQGIVSGLGRNPATASDIDGFTNFIQTDAAVNPGNSGGPLVDIHGKVIGMNVAIATGHDTQGTTEGQSAGISFAIPLATIESVVGQLIETGKVSRGYLGVSWNRNQDPVEYQPAVRRTGVRIESLTDDGPAKDAGLLAGDLITAIDGQPVTDYAVLRSVVTSLRPGTRVAVTAFRDGELREIPVTLGEYPGENLAVGGALRTLGRYGILLDRGDQPRIRLVLPDSDAERAGLKPDQVILAVGGKTVSTTEEMLLALANEGLLIGRAVPLRLSLDNGSTSAQPEEISIQVGR